MTKPSTDILLSGVGFIAEALAPQLARRDAKVLYLTTRASGAVRQGDGNATLSNLIQGIDADRIEPDGIDALVRRCGRVTLVLDLPAAAPTAPSEAQRRLDVLLLGTRQLLMSCARHGRPLLLAVPGDGIDRGVLAEEGEPPWTITAPSSLALATHFATHYAVALAASGLCCALVQLFGIYGPDMQGSGYGGALGVLLDRLTGGRSLAVGATGNAVRTFCHVDDAADGLARLLLGQEPDSTWCGRRLDLGRDEPVTVADVSWRLAALSGQNGDAGTIDSGDISPAPVSPLLADTRPLAEAVGFRAGIDLDTGLARTLAAMGRLAGAAPPVDRALPNIRPDFAVDPGLGRRIGRILISGQATNGGRRQQALEQHLADWLGVAETAVVSSGADALSLALAALPAAPRAKVILPSYTFIATLNAVLGAGLTPVFCDIDPETFTLCPRALARLLAETKDVAWVIPVAVFGVPADLAAICPLAEAAGARVLYDNCHGFGTEVDGARVLSGPTVQTISMHATKVLPGVEGGILLSDDGDLLARFRRLRNHGIATNPLQSTSGMNSKLDEVRAEITLAQLAGIDAALARRRDYGDRLRGFIDRAGVADVLRLQRIPDGVQSNFQNHGVLCPLPDRRAGDAIINGFNVRGVGARSYFHPVLHRLPAFAGRSLDLPHTEQIWTRWVCLPLHARMAEPDLNCIERALSDIAGQLRADRLTFPSSAGRDRPT